MQATEIRDGNWQAIRDRLTGSRQRVWSALYSMEQGTSSDLARRTGDSLLQVRPRLTELVQLGLAECVDRVLINGKSHGVYRAISLENAQAQWEADRAARSEQTMLKLEI